MNSIFRRIAIFSVTILFSFMFLSFVLKDSETIVIKTNIYCDHCKECGSCGGKIERDLGFDKGIKLVRLDDKAMTITVTYNPKKTNPEKIRQTISRYGYDADDVKADPDAYSRLDDCCKK